MHNTATPRTNKIQGLISQTDWRHLLTRPIATLLLKHIEK